jgi:transposase
VGRPAKYPPQFRREAVELVRSSDRSIVEVAQSLGITDSTLHNWLKARREARVRAADPNELSESELEELRAATQGKRRATRRSRALAGGGRVSCPGDDAVTASGLRSSSRVVGHAALPLCDVSRSGSTRG